MSLVCSPFFNPTHTVEFKTVRAMVILAYKYDVEHVRTEALRRLRRHFAITFATIDEYYLPSASMCIKARGRDMIAVVNLASMGDTFDIQPWPIPATQVKFAILPPVVVSIN